MRARLLACACALMLLIVASARADAPALSVAKDRLDASLACSGDLTAGRVPVLLVPGTGEDPDFFDTNYVRALRKLGLSYCTVTLPAHATGDIQVAAEYVVNAIRTMNARAGRRIAIIGHSQGGMVPRWALKYFPDTRAMVDDLVGLAASNHGTTVAAPTCTFGCSAATWQQRDDSKFIRVLNAGGETFAGISYTSVFTHNDEVVAPNADATKGSTALRTGDGARANVATQDICPLNTSEHVALGSTDPVGYALAIDALAHDGPAAAARIDRVVCSQIAQPGVDPVTGLTDTLAANAKLLAQFAGGAILQAEPPLKCYAAGTCPAGASGSSPTPVGGATRRSRLLVSASPRRVRTGRVRIRVRVRVLRRGKTVPVRGVLVRVAGVRARTDAHGVATLRRRFATRGVRTVRATRAGYGPGRVTISVVRRARRG